jgi:hypothetical protein
VVGPFLPHPPPLESTVFEVDLFVIPIQGVDVVLGMQWLKSLGRIEWDFGSMQIRFRHRDQSKALLEQVKEVRYSVSAPTIIVGIPCIWTHTL